MNHYSERQDEMLKHRKVRRRKRFKTRFTIFVCLVLSIGIVLTLFFAPIFEITEIYAVGNSRVSEDEIIARSDVFIKTDTRSGDNIFRTNVQGIINNILTIPYVRAANVRRVFPNRLRIWVSESEPQANISIYGGRYAVIDERGRVLEISHESFDLPTFQGLNVDNPEPGEALSANVEANIEIALLILNEIIANRMLDRIISIDITSLSHITMNYENRVNVIIGNANDLEYKIMFFSNIAETISPHEHGVLDMSLQQPYFRPTN